MPHLATSSSPHACPTCHVDRCIIRHMHVEEGHIVVEVLQDGLFTRPDTPNIDPLPHSFLRSLLTLLRT